MISSEFKSDALKLVAKLAMKRRVGARALRSIIEDIMMDFMFEYPGHKTEPITITKPLVELTSKKIVVMIFKKRFLERPRRLEKLPDDGKTKLTFYPNR